jgi:tetratricopeptide (TPR) repeat protein
MSLNNLGSFQMELGPWEAALEPIRQAVKLYRKLSQTRRDAFLEGLAMSLTNFGILQLRLGLRDEALESTSAARDLYRELAQRSSERFRPKLAGSLIALGAIQVDIGQWEVAVASYEEALDVIWPFFLEQPQAHHRETKAALHNMWIRLHVLGRPATPELEHRRAVFKEKIGADP